MRKRTTARVAKPGPKPKITKPLTIRLHPKPMKWLSVLFGKGCFGNSVEEVATNLLNDRFKQLLADGELADQPSIDGPIPFPTQSEQAETQQTSTSSDK